MATMHKDKNYLYFTNNQGRTYRFNINEGVFYSTQDKPMKSCPSGFTTYMNNIRTETCLVNLMKHLHWAGHSYADLSTKAEILITCDRLDSIGFFSYDANSEITLKYVGKYFKDFVKAYAENSEIGLGQFYREHKMKVLASMCKGIELTEEQVRVLLDLEQGGVDANEMRLSAHYLHRGLLEFFGRKWDCANHLIRFFDMCHKIDHTPTKDDYYRQYINVARTYEMRKKEIDAKAIVEQLAKHAKAWEFENDDFTIIVPSTPAEFEAEAIAQCNCVYSTYMERVVRGETNVVFIRKKSDPTVSHITCEVSNYGRIKQFLLKHNCSPSYDSAEMAFKREFGNYLEEVWR